MREARNRALTSLQELGRRSRKAPEAQLPDPVEPDGVDVPAEGILLLPSHHVVDASLVRRVISKVGDEPYGADLGDVLKARMVVLDYRLDMPRNQVRSEPLVGRDVLVVLHEGVLFQQSEVLLNKGQELEGVGPGLVESDVVHREFQRSRRHLARIFLSSGLQHVSAELFDGLDHMACSPLHNAVQAAQVTPVIGV